MSCKKKLWGTCPRLHRDYNNYDTPTRDFIRGRGVGFRGGCGKGANRGNSNRGRGQSRADIDFRHNSAKPLDNRQHKQDEEHVDKGMDFDEDQTTLIPDPKESPLHSTNIGIPA